MLSNPAAKTHLTQICVCDLWADDPAMQQRGADVQPQSDADSVRETTVGVQT